MRRLWITLGIVLATAAGLGLLFVGGIFGLSEMGGEVVVLETLDAQGAPHHTHLWVVDDQGAAWLRAGQPGSGWLARLEANPQVRLTRNGSTASYRAEAVHDPVVRDHVHALMAEKYGFADRVISASRDGSQSVPVRLVPISSSS